MSTSIDLTGYTGVTTALQRLALSDLQRIALSDAFVKKAQVYATRQMDAAFKAGADIQEGETRVIRGQTWRGWAQRSVKKYGVVVVEGTRFYMRKFARGELDAINQAKVQLMIHQVRGGQFKGISGAIPEHIRNREFEKVWNKRGPKGTNTRYDANSKMMQNTRALQGSLLNMRVSVNGSSIEFRPGTDVSYFQFQNEMRPIFVWDNPIDEPKLADLLVSVINQKMKEGGF